MTGHLVVHTTNDTRRVAALRRWAYEPPRPPADCVFERDHLSTTAHFIVCHTGSDIAAATLIVEDHWYTGTPLRLRNVVTLPTARRNGVGRLIVGSVLRWSPQPVWASIRTSLTSFYAPFEPTQVSGSYTVPGTGTHVDVTFEWPTRHPRDSDETPSVPPEGPAA